MRLLLRRHERRPDPAPLPADDRRPVLIGIVVWLVLGTAAFALREELVAADRAWWLWACVAGALLGVVGLLHLHHRARRAPPP